MSEARGGPAAAAGASEVSHDSHKISQARMKIAGTIMKPEQVAAVRTAAQAATGSPNPVSLANLGGMNKWREPTDPQKSEYAESEAEKVAFHGHPSKTRPGSVTPRSERLALADRAIVAGDGDATAQHLMEAVAAHTKYGGGDWPAEARKEAAKAASKASPTASEAALEAPDGSQAAPLNATGAPTSAALPHRDGSKAPPLSASGTANAAALPKSDGTAAPALRAESVDPTKKSASSPVKGGDGGGGSRRASPTPKDTDGKGAAAAPARAPNRYNSPPKSGGIAGASGGSSSKPAPKPSGGPK